jgi:hypothetical protein
MIRLTDPLWDSSGSESDCASMDDDHARLIIYGLNSRGSSVNGTTATMVMRAASG